MTPRYIYADKIGAGPEHPTKRWGLFTNELSAEQAAERYALPPEQRENWFGIVQAVDGERPSAYLQMCPQANGVTLHTLDEHGRIAAAYSWGAYSDTEVHADDEHPRLFLTQIIGYVYPDGDRFMDRSESVGNVRMGFSPDGDGIEERTLKQGPGQPASVETREFTDVVVSGNWFDVPVFGDWDAFFHPTPDED